MYIYVTPVLHSHSVKVEIGLKDKEKTPTTALVRDSNAETRFLEKGPFKVYL